MKNTMRLGKTTYEIDDDGPTTVRVTRRNSDGVVNIYLPRALVLAYAREHVVRAFVRAAEKTSADEGSR